MSIMEKEKKKDSINAKTAILQTSQFDIWFFEIDLEGY